MKKIVPDTSILIEGKLSEFIKEGKLSDAEIIIPRTVIDELQAQASRGRDIGFKGLDEIKKIRAIGKKKGITIEFKGERPTMEEIQLARKGRIDALIRDVAAKEGAKLMTADFVQALVAEAEGVAVEHIPKVIKKRIRLETYFTPQTQSIHLKTGVPPLAKVGPPGETTLVKIRESLCTEDEIKEVMNEVVSKARVEEQSFIEISKAGALVVQLGNYRICVAQPPFSDGFELTAVRPIAKVTLNDYTLHEELKRRILEMSQGILIAGPPGSGKTSFASALAEFLYSKGKIVKTFEQPRDLQVGPEITQYAPLEGDWAKTSDILLLVRPDYTIFDEIRRTNDFKIFGDMRLAGVGMIGVIHATTPVAAIQRFIGRIELGIIPNIVDTVIFIKGGKIFKVYELGLIVKVPTGMVEADLTRPVVEIRDFETKALEYEIYTYGEENIIIPVTEKPSALKELAKERISHEIRNFDPDPQIEIAGEDRIIVRVSNNAIARLIGKQGKTIEEIEKRLGLHISVEPKEATFKQELQWNYEESGAYISVIISPELIGKQVDIYGGDEFLLTAFVGKKGMISIRKSSDFGRKILGAVASKRLRVLA